MPMEGVIKMARKRRLFEEKDNEPPVSAEAESVPATRKGIVCNSPSVRVRRNPNTTSDTIAVLSAGDEIFIIEKLPSGFYKILLSDNRIAYISWDYCREE